MGTTELQIIAAVICLVLGLPLGTAKASSVAVVPVSKPHCEGKCGNLSVPFPFGIGDPECFLDEWFELVCENSSTGLPKPILKRFQLEVLNITMENDGYPGMSYNYDQHIQVRAPVSFFNCAGREPPKRVDLTGAPFSFSPHNVFVAASCGVRALLSSTSGNTFSQIGCTSSCPGDNNIANNDGISCNGGVDCCETSITAILDSFEITFDNSTGTTQPADGQCKPAFLVDSEYWGRYKNETSSFTEIREIGYVPLLMKWNLGSNYSLSYLNLDRTSKHFLCRNVTSYSYNSYVCYCYRFRGNPYLLDGCSQDINECEGYLYPCSDPGSSCVNTHGGYYCSYKKKYLLIGFGSGFGALFVLFGCWGTYRKIKTRKETNRKRNFFKRNGGLLLQQQLSSGEGNNVERSKLFDSNELDKATLHFSVDRILGQGGQGTVYKGMLDDGNIVAVKKSRIVDEEKLSEFINEVVILSQINHRNVVQLLGCCLETEVPLLVYEFIPNGTLSQYIHGPNDEFPFTWKTRLRVATEVAGALSYLHSAAYFPIYHRDIKSNNILLDEKFRAKIADFGTSRTISLEQTHLTTLVYGTFGYLDPEYFQSSQFTDKSDVYSFGVVLVEILTGQKVICPTRAEEGRNLATYFTMTMQENRLFDIVDGQLLEDGPQEDILSVACLALRCLNMSGRNRPTMKDVAMELEGLRKSKGEAPCNPRKTYEEMDYVRTQVIEPWDNVNMSTASIESTTASLFLHQEMPLLSFRSKSNKIL